ncbi:hypothetical protein LJC01_02155 [Clostridiaceae bacterium OttesenSCG-928-D20]|nr:hypothetical protein [Clostridiaceae bacterium OttesenSCG-928-D20]
MNLDCCCDELISDVSQLLFKRTNDIARLVLAREEGLDVSKLDLSLLSELKLSDKGNLEVKLLDRAALLRYLTELVRLREELSGLKLSETDPDGFLTALENSVAEKSLDEN